MTDSDNNSITMNTIPDMTHKEVLTGNSIMFIPAQKDYSYTATNDGVIINFRDSNGVLRKARISNWHLKPVFGLDTNQRSLEPLSRALDSLMHIFNSSEIRELKAAMNALDEISAASDNRDESTIEATKERLGFALRDVMFRSHASAIIAPLLILAIRDKKYDLIQEPWPYRAPPAHLYHLGNKGFEGRSKLGVLACPSPNSKDYWVVDGFDTHALDDRYCWSVRSSDQIDDLANAVAAKLRPDFQKMGKSIDDIPRTTTALLQGTVKKRLGKLGIVHEENFTASPHFASISWRGCSYILGKNAAIIIEALYIIQKYHELPSYNQNELFAQIYGSNKKNWPSTGARIQNFFRTGDAKRLWKDGFIAHNGKGSFFITGKIHTHTR